MDKFSTALNLKAKAFKLAESGQSTMALKLISNFCSETPTEVRILGHSRAEVLMLSGKYQEALEVLLEIQKKTGNHVALLTDIAICYYTLSDFTNWKFTFNDLKKEFELNKDILVFERRVMAELNIAKFMEEDGDVAFAASTYLRLMREMDERKDMPRFYRSMSQALRVLATFRSSGQLFESYRQMLSVGNSQVGLHAHVDVQQALFLADLVLVGPQSSNTRAIEIFQNENVSLLHKQIIYFDFLEESLVQNFEIDDRIKSFSNLFTDINPFEAEIKKLALDKEQKTDIQHLLSLSSQMTLSCYIRILGAHLAKTRDAGFANELRNQIRVIISSLNSESQQLWISRYKKYFLANEEIQLSYNSKSKILSRENKLSDLSRRPGFQSLIELFNQNQTVETEIAIKHLWNVTFDPTYYKSLRMTVHRLNDIIFDLCGIPKAIEINKQKIEIKGKIFFRLE